MDQRRALTQASEKIEKGFGKLLELQRVDDAKLANNHNATNGFGQIDPAFRSAGYKLTAKSLCEPLGTVSKLIEDVLRQGADAREAMTQSCDITGRIYGFLDRMRQELSAGRETGQRHDYALQFERCWGACERLLAVLEDCRLAQQFREAADKAAKMNFSRLDPVALSKPASESKAEEAAQSSQIADNIALSQTRAALLLKIDDAKSREEALPAIRCLFNYYAANLGYIEGRGLECAVDDMTNHVKREWSERNDRLVASGQRSLGEKEDAFFRDFVRKSIDIDGDGCVTFEEACVGFKNVVDDIDPVKRL